MLNAVQLSVVLQNEPVAAGNALPYALGDSYLCVKNPIYAAVRRRVVELGYEFSSEDTALRRNYQVWPLSCLGRLLEEKVLPYFDNRSVIAETAAAKPRLALPLQFLVDHLLSNHVFHESCHAVAHAALEADPRPLTEISSDAGRQVIWRASLEEAFANATETLALYVVRSSAHTLFFSLNSYMRYSAKVRDIVDQAIVGLGTRDVFRLLFLSYAAANLLPDDGSEEVRARIMDIAGISPAEDSSASKSAMTVGRIGFTLSSVFRSSTARAYFRLIDQEAAFEEVQRDGFLADHVKEPLNRLSHLFASLAIPEEAAHRAAS